MKIKLKEVPIKELFAGYKDSGEDGVVGYGGKLDIRPAYQREFIYKDKQRDAVIETVRKNFPLNIMYWVKNKDGTYEVLDGQQRTISICSYLAGNFSVNFQAFHNLEPEEQEQFLNYKLMIYFCEGDNRKKLDWFQTINIAGEKLSTQELRNAVYHGAWLSDAKRYFSRIQGPAYNIASAYMKGSVLRQDYLETAINWISSSNIEDYMSANQHKPNANILWLYFQEVINWVKASFPNYRKQMRGLPWGLLYNNFKWQELDPKKLEEEVSALLIDDDVTKKAGAYLYVLTRDEKYLSIRAFSDKQRLETYEKQNGVCPACINHFDIGEMEADHITPWAAGGKTTSDNCQMLCKRCNRTKSNK